MASFKILIDTELPTLNQYTKANRNSRFEGGAMKKRVTNNVKLLALKSRFKLPVNQCFDVEFIWCKPNDKTDHDNISFGQKFVLDGLVASKSIQNDSPRYIRNISHKFIVDKSRKYHYCIMIFKAVEV